MHELYAEADMAITRAGAGTLSELALFGLPAVIIPYPHAGNHQKANADFFQSREAVIQIPEKDLNPEGLSGIILTLKRDPALRRKYSENLSKLACPNAAESLANLAWDILQKHSRGGGRNKPT
jgi:UDP-N-acetylglucosamine--N-acetylmuramyl-(pentapeptide) pyrophosphoryl-undecaprenol N-acetylglucosamine transferase